MIKFGMSLPAIFNQLRKGYIKVRGTEPKGLDLIKIKQEAMQKFEDMRKVLDMQGNPIDPSKPIMGGTQMGQRGIFDNIFNRMQSQMGKKPKVIDEDTGKGFIDFVRKTDPEGAAKLQKTEDEIRAAIEAGNKRAAKKLRDKKKKKDDPEEKAYGGRIGLKEGEGIMQMASVDEPFFRDDYLDENAQMMFKKQYKDLTPDELEEFREEMMRLMNKFSSAPDPMDERNMVMENIARQEFGKPLKDLSEDEIIQIEEMMDEMSVKPNRGAQSIKLAEGGRIGLKDGMDRRKFMKIMGGLATLPVIGKFAKGVKLAAPAVTKAAELTGPALAKIVETVMDFGKLVSVKGRRVKEMVTKKKYKDIEVEEDVGDGSYIIKKGDKEIYYKPGRQDETGGFDDDIIEILEDRIKKAGGGLSYMLGE